MPPRICIECRSFDHDTPRAEERTIVRCMEPRNKGPVWPKLVAGPYPACPHFQPLANEDARNDA